VIDAEPDTAAVQLSAEKQLGCRISTALSCHPSRYAVG
jgi:hypothetical protein